jgi:hypothetical protein
MLNIPIREFEPNSAIDDAAALEQFQKQWPTYQKLVDADALSHQAVGKILHDTLTATFAEPFAFLDIACGDASQVAQALAGTKVRQYMASIFPSRRSSSQRRIWRAQLTRSSSTIATSSRL